MNSIRGKNVFTIFLCFVLCFSALIFAAGCSDNNRHEEQPYIVSFEKTSSENSEDVYTITYSDGTTSQFTVTNGKDGNDLSISEIWEAYIKETDRILRSQSLSGNT